VDECHTLTGQVLKDLINEYGGHIGYRYGVTGTFPPDEVDRFACHASIGQILYSLPAWKLIEEGFLSEIEIQPVEIQDKKKIGEDFPEFEIERTYLTTSNERLEVIANDLINTTKIHGNTLVLVGDVEQGKMLQKLIPNSVFLYGQNYENRVYWYFN
jgi:superfamily II DNA or RNA helicase